MYKLLVFAALLGGSRATAMTFVNVAAGYNLRIGASKLSAQIKTLRRPVVATLLQSKGDWRRVCIGGVGTVCEGGQKAWVYKKAVTVADDTPMPTERQKTSCVGGECARKPRQKIPDAIEPIADAIDGNPRGLRLPRGFDPLCSTFITANGLGPWGRAMVSAAQRVAPTCFYKRNFYGSMCPNYTSLPIAKKNAMIAMTFAAIATTEATCKPHARNPHGTNTVADGMFQLEQSAAFRRKVGRDEEWCKTTPNVDTQSMRFQSECAVSTIDDTVCGKFGSYLFDSRGYWQKLRNNREITRRIRKTAQDWGLCVGGSDDD